MKTASVARMKARFSAYIRESKTGPVVITRNGKPVGVLLAVEDEDEIERLILGYTPRLRALVEAAEQRLPRGPGPHTRNRGGSRTRSPVRRPSPIEPAPRNAVPRRHDGRRGDFPTVELP
jgi:prevent-host-death family protein